MVIVQLIAKKGSMSDPRDSHVLMKVTESEWRLIMKALALFGGLKVTSRPEERDRAWALNKALLQQRQTIIRQEVGEAAIVMATQDEMSPADVLES